MQQVNVASRDEAVAPKRYRNSPKMINLHLKRVCKCYIETVMQSPNPATPRRTTVAQGVLEMTFVATNPTILLATTLGDLVGWWRFESSDAAAGVTVIIVEAIPLLATFRPLQTTVQRMTE